MDQSLYAKYILERENKQIIETEHGFMTYSIMSDGPFKGDLFVENFYVEPDYRATGLAKQFGEQITELARDYGSKRLICTVQPNTNGATYNLIGLLKWGFVLDSAATNLICLTKEI